MGYPLLVEAVDGFTDHPHSHTDLFLIHLALALSLQLTVKCTSFEILQKQEDIIFIVKKTKQPNNIGMLNEELDFHFENELLDKEVVSDGSFGYFLQGKY